MPTAHTAASAREVSAPPTRLRSLYPSADLLDAFAIDVPVGTDADLETLARAAFERPVAWIRALTSVRDVAVGWVGIKSSRAIGNEAATRGPVIGYFPLLSMTDRELILGADDSHLDFRAAILLRVDAKGGRQLVAVTVVHCHNWLGRAYLALIVPFHKLVVKANLQQAIKATKR